MPARKGAFAITDTLKARREKIVTERLEEREIGRQLAQRSYAAAQINRLTLDWITGLKSQDEELKGDARRLRGAARATVRDTSFGSRYVNLIAENVIGDKGIGLQAKIRTTRDTLNTSLNQKIEDAFALWGLAENCSVDGQHDWLGIQRLAYTVQPQDGEYMIRILRGFPNDFLFALQPLDVDLIDDQYTLEASRAPNGNEIRMGVEIDKWGRPVAYHCWTRHPSDTGSLQRRERTRIPAEDIIHDFVPLRPGQTRGVTWFAPVLVNHNMLAAYIEAEITAARIGASNMAAIAIDPEKSGGAMPSALAGQTAITQEVEPGRFWRLNPGETLVNTDFGHPSGAFGPFIKFSARAEATGLNVAYSSLSGDLEAVNFSSIRAGIIQERDFYRWHQQRAIARLCRRVFREWVPFAVLSGHLPAAAIDATRSPRAVEWRPRGWPWVDPLNDIQAAQLEVQLGTNDRTTLAGERGRDFETVLTQLAEEERLAEELGVTLGAPQPAAPKQSAQDAADSADSADSTDNPDGEDNADSEDAADRAHRVTLLRRYGND